MHTLHVNTPPFAPRALFIASAFALALFMLAQPVNAADSPSPLQKLSDFEDARGGKENVTEVERRAILRSVEPSEFDLPRALATEVTNHTKAPEQRLSDLEDARGGKENVTEVERRAVLRGTVPRATGRTMAGEKTASLRGEVTEINRFFAEIRYQGALGHIVHRKFSITDRTFTRAHIDRGDQVQIRFVIGTDEAIAIRDLAPAGAEGMVYGARDYKFSPGAPS